MLHKWASTELVGCSLKVEAELFLGLVLHWPSWAVSEVKLCFSALQGHKMYKYDKSPGLHDVQTSRILRLWLSVDEVGEEWRSSELIFKDVSDTTRSSGLRSSQAYLSATGNKCVAFLPVLHRVHLSSKPDTSALKRVLRCCHGYKVTPWARPSIELSRSPPLLCEGKNSRGQTVRARLL